MSRMSDIIEDIENMSMVIEVANSDDEFYISTEECELKEFRSNLSEILLDSDDTLGLEIRNKKNKEGYIGIIMEDVNHPLPIVTLYCGALDLNDRNTYQIQSKTADLVDNVGMSYRYADGFAGAVAYIVYNMLTKEDIPVDEFCKNLEINAGKVNREAVKVLRHMDEN